MRVDEAPAQELVVRARSEGVELVGPGGLLSGLTKSPRQTRSGSDRGAELLCV